MIYKIKTQNFNPRFEIVSCFIEYDGKIILLHRQENKSQGGRWGLPAGKVENGEDLKKAVIREVKEETAIDICGKQIHYFGATYHRHRDYDFIFHMFSTKLNFKPDIKINLYEHKEFTWKTPSEVIAIKKDKIVEDLNDVCKLFYKMN